MFNLLINFAKHPTVIKAAGTCFLLSSFDRGLANILGLETCRHGTNIVSAVSICLFGANPNWGYSKIGSTRNLRADNTEGKFYFFIDTSEIRPKTHNILKRILPNVHKAIATKNLYLSFFPDWLQENRLINFMGYAIALPTFMISPTLRFRFTATQLKEIAIMDPFYFDDIALYTTQRIGIQHIGLIGTLFQGINTNVFSSIKDNPMKCFTGVLQLILTAVLTQASMPYLAIACVLEMVVLPFLRLCCFYIS